MRTAPRALRSRLLPALVASLAAAASATAQVSLSAVTVASGLTKPTYLAAPPGDSTRMMVTEQRGIVKLIKNGALQATPFLNIDAEVPELTYSGMLGLAFHPDYAANGRFYVFHTTGPVNNMTIWIVEYQRSAGNPDVADPATKKVIFKLTSPAPTAHHLGGWIGFGPDGYLYVPLGDGGTTGDAQGGVRSQSLSSLWGKILRIDVNGDDFPADAERNYAIPADNPFVGAVGEDEIWARGMRNPYRASFDRETGDLWVGDVGGTQREELDVFTTLDAGANGGWNCMEGNLCTTNANCSCPSANLKPPFHEYLHSVGLCITGGVRYRGCAMPSFKGAYFFGDYQNNKAFSLKVVNGLPSAFTTITAQLGNPTTPVAFCEDAAGEILMVLHTPGLVRRIVQVPAMPDADGSGVADVCEGYALGDLNADGVVNGGDLGILLGAWSTQGPLGDLNYDSKVDGGDLGILIANWT